MVDEKWSEWDDAVAILTDKVPFLDDPAGTPSNKLESLADLKALLAPTLTKTHTGLVSNFTTTSATPVLITGMTITLTNVSGGIAYINLVGSQADSGANARHTCRMRDDGVTQNELLYDYYIGTFDIRPMPLSYAIETDGSVIDCYIGTSGSTATVYGANSRTVLNTIEISP